MNEKKPTLHIIATSFPAYDRRMQRMASALSSFYQVYLWGHQEQTNKQPKETSLDFQIRRIYNPFKSGPLFYLYFNLTILLKLIFKKTHAFYSVDADTLPAAFVLKKLRNKPWVFDAHEWFSEVPELNNRTTKKAIWKSLENSLIPYTDHPITVNKSLSTIFQQKYHKPFAIIRNIPPQEPPNRPNTQNYTLPSSPFFIYVGVLNEGRGLELYLEAVAKTKFPLVICGQGILEASLKQKAKTLEIEQQVYFLGQIPPQELHAIISQAHAGLLLLEDYSLSYYYSLANKFFDYLHAGIPQICIDFPEYQQMIHQHKVGCLSPFNLEKLCHYMHELMENKNTYSKMKIAIKEAQQAWTWDKEQQKLLGYLHPSIVLKQ